MFTRLNCKNSIISKCTLGAISLIFLSGCAPSIPKVESIQPLPVKTHEIIIKDKINSSWETNITDYEFGGEVLRVRTDSTGDYLAVIYNKSSDKKRNIFQTISTVDHSPKGTLQIPNSTRIESFNSGIIHLREYFRNNNLLIESSSGKISKELPGLYYHNQFDNKMFCMKKDTFSLWLDSGTLLWERPRIISDQTPNLRLWKIDNHVFVSGGGLWYAELENGDGWYHVSETWNKSHAKQVARACLIETLALLAGTYSTGGYGDADITYGLKSNPLVFGDKVYFASKNELTCFDIKSGNISWQSPFDSRSGISHLSTLQDQLGVIAQFGKDMHNGKLRDTNNPYVSAFDLESGEEKWRVVPEPLLPISEVVCSNEYYVFLTEAKTTRTRAQSSASNGVIYIITADGDLRTIKPGFTPNILEIRGNSLIGINLNNIVVWDINSMEQRWTNETTINQFVISENLSTSPSNILGGLNSTPNAHFLNDEDRLWLVTGEDEASIVVYNLNSGSLERSIPTKHKIVGMSPNHFILISNNKVGIFEINTLFEDLN